MKTIGTIKKNSTIHQSVNLAPWILLFLPIVLIFPFMVSGIIRYFTAWDLQNTLLPSVCITIPFLLWLIRNISCSFAFNRKNTLFLLISCLPITIIIFHVLYNPVYNGFIGIGGDSGNHVFLQNSFLQLNPKEYNGFISLYAFNGWLETIFKRDSFFSFKTSFYSLVLFLSLIPPVYWSVGCDFFKKKKKIFFFTYAIGIPIAYMFFFYILGPILHDNQGEGFFAHIFSFIIIVFAWILYSFIPSACARMIALIACIFFYRFTYGLNLPDLFLCLATACCLEGCDQTNSKKIRILCFLGIPIALGIGWLAFQKLFPVILNLDGGIIPPDMRYLIPTLLVSSVGVCFFCFYIFHDQFSPYKNTNWIRHAMIPAVLCIYSALLIIGITITGHKLRYYAYKSVLMGQVISILAIVSFLPILYARFWQKKYFPLNFLQNLFDTQSLKIRIQIAHNLNTIIYLILSSFLIGLFVYHFMMITFVNLNILTLPYTALISGVLIFNFSFLLSKHQAKILSYSLYFCVLIFIGNFFSLKAQYDLYQKRLTKTPALAKSISLYDGVAVSTIKNTLTNNHALFGGYLYPSWPQINFINGLFNSLNAWNILTYGELNQSANHCVFWSNKPEDAEIYSKLRSDGKKSTADIVQELTKIETKECKSYQIQWNLNHNETLCWVCF